ncbi:helicase associated domain-containing protein (plasmid) [Kitasatospora griseola]|uniref:helicase associated domain-containing protein n=1 Tax=Kitasatospora griseola TaxID=2064 RepID=UPI00385581C6
MPASMRRWRTHVPGPRCTATWPYPERRARAVSLGEWLLHQRNRATRRARLSLPPSPRVEQLTAIDPWWNPPWKLNWQRNYYRARGHQRCGHPFDPAAGVPAAKNALGVWVRRQCAAFATLHPGRQQLLAAIGITAQAARHRAGPRLSRRLTTTPQFDTDVVRARAYAAEHGHLVPAASERYNGFPIGRWLHEHRQRARRTGDASPPARALSAIDPWWNPPWPLPWQRSYRRAEALGGPQHLHTPPSVRKWVQVQRSCWPVLHSQQQQLLARIGITAATAPGPQRAGRNPPGLKHAAAHAAAHGHLAVATHATHDGFHLGKWLIAQRAKARSGRLSPATQQALAALDPWWNPPWDFTWQRAYQRVRADTAVPQAKSWIQQQQQHWAQLHPEQRTLLTGIGAGPP